MPAFLGTVRDSYEGLVEEFITDDKELYQRLQNYLSQYQKEDMDKLVFHDNDVISLDAKYNIQELFYKVNMEAAEEIAYQLRLRNITGIIMIDFIDMDDMNHRKNLMQALEEFVKPDPVKTTVVDMTALNLVELTRKKTRKPVLEQLKEIENVQSNV